MSREIKFRAWNNLRNEICDNLMNSIVLQSEVNKLEIMSFEDKYLELMQYTGFKDKNGKEIYEGDIIKTNNLDGPFFVCTVDYMDGSFVFTSKDGHEYYPDKKSEIIGNIYENPELLK